MNEKRDRLLNVIYNHFGVTAEADREALTEAVLEHLEKDREYFVVLYKKGQGICPEPAAGRPCKLVPLASFTSDSNSETDRTIWLRTLYLMVTEQRVRLVHSTARVAVCPGYGPNFFFPDYVPISPFEIPEKLTLLSPGEIREVTSALDRKFYAMAFHAHSKMYREDVLEQIPQKTERTMFALYNTPPETYQMESGETVTGTLVPVGVDHEARVETEQEDKILQIEVELCMLRTETDVRYVIRSIETTRLAVLEEDEDEPDSYLRQYSDSEERRIYRFATLSDITDAMYSYY